jgi:EAL domain-containing protein (putative c-di-GMP-specific phosphodiesterase class I)
MEIRTPLIVILISIILIVIYLRKNLPQLASARIFFVFLIAVFFNNISEIFESAVFNYLSDPKPGLRFAVQAMYIGSLVFVDCLMCIYVYSKTNRNKNGLNLAVVIASFPGVIAIFSVFILGLEYGVTENGLYYNHGRAVDICYAVGLTYIILSLLRIFFLRSRITKDNFLAMLIGLLSWSILVLYHFFNRSMQVSAIAMMLMEMILFIAMENPKEYYERSIDGIRNKDAFIMTLEEAFGFRKDFFVVSVIFLGKTGILSGDDRSDLTLLMKTVGELSEKNMGSPAYLYNWNALCCIVKEPSKVENFMSVINNFKDGERKNYRTVFSVLEIPKYAKSADEAMQILSYVSGEYAYMQSSPNLVIDDSVVDKMMFRNTIEDVVRKAVKEKAFEVYYQPILRVEDGTFSSAEALVRLKRPDNEKYISPEDFIPVAEKCGLILEIDDLVFEKVCSFIARENLSSYGIRMIEVNLSGNEVVDEQTHLRLINKMKKYHIPPKFINFEVTETSYISNDEVFKENVEKLKAMGSTFSMDDFGSGYSNLLEILKMDYALVKLDKEFVWNCLDPDKPENMRMLEYTINFLKDYGLHILAEGVETLDQAKLLIDKGVEYLQGFYYSRPVSEADYLDFLKTQKGLFSSERR